MSEKFRLDGHLYYSSPKQFFRDDTEITQGEFYNALFLRLKHLKILKDTSKNSFSGQIAVSRARSLLAYLFVMFRRSPRGSLHAISQK